jgi:hypothetical protein
MTMAVGNKGMPPPADFDTGMRGDVQGTTFLFWKCISESNCDFSQISDWADSFVSQLKRNLAPRDIDDKCAVNPTCKECIEDKLNRCGWCSKNVIYKNGSIEGKQCAGHNGDGSKEAFVCYGIYSTETCDPFPTTTAGTTTSSSGSGSGSGSGSKKTNFYFIY